jgi:tetratricopeptide (TPR) repeat protein
MYDEVITIFKKVYGNEHPTVATSMSNKATVLNTLEKYDQALELYDLALNIHINVHAGDLNHPEIAIGLHNKATCLKSLGKIKEAEMIGKQAIDILINVLGPNHPNTLIVKEVWGG